MFAGLAKRLRELKRAVANLATPSAAVAADIREAMPANPLLKAAFTLMSQDPSLPVGLRKVVEL